jgi:hypothetical protein
MAVRYGLKVFSDGIDVPTVNVLLAWLNDVPCPADEPR